jgi:hypothetical protein
MLAAPPPPPPVAPLSFVAWSAYNILPFGAVVVLLAFTVQDRIQGAKAGTPLL